MRDIQPFDVVALREDVPDLNLVAGQVGTIVEDVAPGVFEVEFSDLEGRTYATVALDSKVLMTLHYEPVATT